MILTNGKDSRIWRQVGDNIAQDWSEVDEDSPLTEY